MTSRVIEIFADNKKKRKLINLYIHRDGYVENGVGSDLIKIIENSLLVNGLSQGFNELYNDKNAIVDFNGMSDFTAFIVSFFKQNKVGGVYIEEDGTHGDYIYSIYPDSDNTMSINNKGKNKILLDINGENYNNNKQVILDEYHIENIKQINPLILYNDMIKLQNERIKRYINL